LMGWCFSGYWHKRLTRHPACAESRRAMAWLAVPAGSNTSGSIPERRSGFEKVAPAAPADTREA
jgi:hypothetical protein